MQIAGLALSVEFLATLSVSFYAALSVGSLDRFLLEIHSQLFAFLNVYIYI